jgi:hypothetical protein
MSLQTSPEGSLGVFGAIKNALGLFADTNKAIGVDENSTPTPTDEYESTMSEVDILQLTAQRKKTYSVYYTPIEASQKLAFDYWVGKHRNEDMRSTPNQNDVTDNRIFSAIETFLPIATADPSEIGQKIAHDIKGALVDWADVTKLRRKLARMTRHWSIYRIGVAKLSWDIHTKSIKLDIINPKRMLWDKDGYIDEGGNFVGEYTGEKKQATAKTLIEMFPSKRSIIIAKAKGKLGTKLEYFEWWHMASDIFFTLDDDTVLGKFKNPNWNYDGVQIDIDPETQQEVKTEIQGTNHLKVKSDPYVFLAIFNTGLQPHDETSLVLQNIPLQDQINRRQRQIDKNVDSMNNGMVVSGKAFTEDQASQAASALRRGVAIRVPNGDVREAVQRFPAASLPADVFNSLKDSRQELDNIFGTAGSSAEGTANQDTVRGKILVNQMDSSRIGGGVTEQIEQVSDTIYNKVVQFMFVYYDEEHFVTTAGAVSGQELITLKNQNFPLLKTLSITVKEGSLVPKDPLTQRNQAIDMWSSNSIDPLSYFKALDVPDPVQATNQLILWQMLQKGQIQPQQYLPTFQIAQPAQLGPTQGTGGPAVSPPPPSPMPEGNPAPEAGSPGAVSAESKQLLGAVPLK